ncbi:hypothetical protein [Pararhizobium sp. IMCC21322]|uniref:hypothetical protein n=1 Tax=Pararhizobium sp. IMCC21322 TaxID=3067903 RepID=UPI0027423044|nr:hypothetical protein [Pararhizobium sp. IMCC21322]
MTIKRFFSAITLSTAAAIIAQPALAHSGYHGEFGVLSALQHIAQSPFHLVLAGLAGGFALVLLRVVRHSRGKDAAHLPQNKR